MHRAYRDWCGFRFRLFDARFNISRVHYRHLVNENPGSHYLTLPETLQSLATIRTRFFFRRNQTHFFPDSYRHSTHANNKRAACISPRSLTGTVDTRPTVVMPYTAIYAVASRKLPKLYAITEFVKTSIQFYRPNSTILCLRGRLRNDTSAVIARHGLAWVGVG